MLYWTILLFVLLVLQSEAAYHSQYVIPRDDGTLVYTPYNENGDIIADFSQVGYGQGDIAIPDKIPTVKTLKPVGNGQSDVANIQNAINNMTSFPVKKDGFRGAILLGPGEYNIDATINLNVSGVVLRGSGTQLTTLYGSAKKAYDLIKAGNSAVTHKYSGKVIELNGYIKTGAKRLDISEAKSNFKTGDRVFIFARKNEKWINVTGMNMLKYYAPADRKETIVDWTPFDSRHERIVTAVGDNWLEIDVPLVEAIDPQWGGGYIRKYGLALLIDHVGVEDLCSYSYFDPNITKIYKKTTYYADENHAERLVVFYGVFDGFARRICGRFFNHFVGVKKFSKRITISDANHRDPVSVLDGTRRYTFHVQMASQVLFENCKASGARHAFVFTAHSTGPNVFFNCSTENDFASSEPHDRWSVGGLYDNCNATIAVQNRLYYGTGHGWAGAHFVCWNTRGSLKLQSPVTDWNFAIGHVGARAALDFPYAVGGANRTWEHHQFHVEPKSLFLAQRLARKISNQK